MKWLLLLCLCVYAVRCQDDYDEYDMGDKTDPKTVVDPRGHRPLSKGRETYSPARNNPAPISGGSHYRGRPTEAPARGTEQEKEEQPEAGGCTHASEQMGVLCPTGCELKTAILKQERSVKEEVRRMQKDVDDLSRSSNTIYNYVDGMSSALRERQLVSNENGDLVSQYTDDLETQHVYAKEAIDTVFPSNIRILQGVLEKIRMKIQRVEKAILAQRDECREQCTVSCPIPVVSGKECEDIYRKGGRDSGMYLVQPDSFYQPYKVYCDQTTQNGGWTTIQNRMDGSVDFGRRWDNYRSGFGNIAFDVGKGHCSTPGEYWLGNERISQLTKQGPTEVLMEMEDWSGNKVHAQYKQFTIQSEASRYVMAINGYSGTAGNVMLEGATELSGENRTMTIHNGMMFSTYDRDNDNWTPGDPSKQCSREDGGGWWYNRCHSANPNGRYYWGGAYTRYMAKHGTDDGMVWMNWKGSWYSLKAICMKIRPYFASR
ncbi:fibrinogen beta chain-like [Oncorhynchus mykiss]|uniref:fibrinogen beta chain n=1 Tax=Oncorhynchus mykiss TaxID=8022 RepID=UPI0018779C66|nr:fibrinogen beta chain [Oncorhynchus mykiss]XP_036830349.1 fibrinogen beta chain-like [Oncorhynchus mykiss]